MNGGPSLPEQGPGRGTSAPGFLSYVPKPLPLSFFKRPSEVVAPELIGTRLVVTRRGLPLVATITEVEAYLGTGDPASHVWKGRNSYIVRNLYAPPGSWYVYRSHGLHWCANLTTRGKDEGHAILIRGVLATDARTLTVFRRRRGPQVKEKDLSNGPGKLTQALGIDLSLDGLPMAGSWAQVFAGKGELEGHETRVTPRIGLTRAIDWPLRWIAK
jgi:DNA-3-methyladenine glycosylase